MGKFSEHINMICACQEKASTGDGEAAQALTQIYNGLAQEYLKCVLPSPEDVQMLLDWAFVAKSAAHFNILLSSYSQKLQAPGFIPEPYHLGGLAKLLSCGALLEQQLGAGAVYGRGKLQNICASLSEYMGSVAPENQEPEDCRDRLVAFDTILSIMVSSNVTVTIEPLEVQIQQYENWCKMAPYYHESIFLIKKIKQSMLRLKDPHLRTALTNSAPHWLDALASGSKAISVILKSIPNYGVSAVAAIPPAIETLAHAYKGTVPLVNHIVDNNFAKKNWYEAFAALEQKALWLIFSGKGTEFVGMLSDYSKMVLTPDDRPPRKLIEGLILLLPRLAAVCPSQNIQFSGGQVFLHDSTSQKLIQNACIETLVGLLEHPEYRTLGLRALLLLAKQEPDLNNAVCRSLGQFVATKCKKRTFVLEDNDPVSALLLFKLVRAVDPDDKEKLVNNIMGPCWREALNRKIARKTKYAILRSIADLPPTLNCEVKGNIDGLLIPSNKHADPFWSTVTGRKNYLKEEQKSERFVREVLKTQALSNEQTCLDDLALKGLESNCRAALGLPPPTTFVIDGASSNEKPSHQPPQTKMGNNAGHGEQVMGAVAACRAKLEAQITKDAEAQNRINEAVARLQDAINSLDGAKQLKQHTQNVDAARISLQRDEETLRALQNEGEKLLERDRELKRRINEAFQNTETIEPLSQKEIDELRMLEDSLCETAAKYQEAVTSAIKAGNPLSMPITSDIPSMMNRVDELRLQKDLDDAPLNYAKEKQERIKKGLVINIKNNEAAQKQKCKDSQKKLGQAIEEKTICAENVSKARKNFLKLIQTVKDVILKAGRDYDAIADEKVRGIVQSFVDWQDGKKRAAPNNIPIPKEFVDAVAKGNAEIVMKMIENSPDLISRYKEFFPAIAKHGDALAHVLAYAMLFDTVEINALDNTGKAALHYAVENRNIACVEILLSCDNLNCAVQKEPNKVMALHIACGMQDQAGEALFDALFEKMNDKQLFLKMNNGEDVLDIAIWHDSLSKTQKILKKIEDLQEEAFPVDLYAQAIRLAAFGNNGSNKVLMWLYSYCWEHVKDSFSNEEKLFIYAEVIKDSATFWSKFMLLHSSAPTNLTAKEYLGQRLQCGSGNSCQSVSLLLCAYLHRNLDLVEHLEDKLNFTFGPTGYEGRAANFMELRLIFMRAADYGWVDVIERLCKRYDPSDSYGIEIMSTALSCAAIQGNVSIATAIFDYAAQSRDLARYERLLNPSVTGSPIRIESVYSHNNNSTDSKVNKPLVQAIFYGHIDTACLLIRETVANVPSCLNVFDDEYNGVPLKVSFERLKYDPLGMYPIINLLLEHKQFLEMKPLLEDGTLLNCLFEPNVWDIILNNEVGNIADRCGRQLPPLETAQRCYEESFVGRVIKLYGKSVVSNLPAGLLLHKLPGDGHCLFRAVSYSLGDSVSSLRQRVAQHINENSNDYRQFFSGNDREFKSYLDRMATSNEWGGELEITAIQRLTGSPIVVIQAQAPPIIPPAQDYPNKPVFLYYNGRDHYDVFALCDGAQGMDILNKIRSQCKKNLLVTYPGQRSRVLISASHVTAVKDKFNSWMAHVVRQNTGHKSFVNLVNENLHNTVFSCSKPPAPAAPPEIELMRLYYENRAQFFTNVKRASPAELNRPIKRMKDGYEKETSLLHILAKKGDIEAVRTVFFQGADPNKRDSKERTPFHVSCSVDPAAAGELAKLFLHYKPA